MKNLCDMVYLATFAIVVIGLCVSHAGCSLKRSPAQQTSQNTPLTRPVVHTSQPMPIEQVDLDGDGTLSASERQSLIGDQPGVIPTFATIIGLVLFASIASAWASVKWAPRTPNKHHNSTRSTEPTEPTHDQARE
jgi:hypothetical protein